MARRKRIDKHLLAQVAYLHYVKEMTQARIGQRIGKHQATVNRLLKDARNLGVVHSVIDVDSAVTGTEDNLQADELREAFNLKDALVVDVGDFSNSDDVHIALANAAASQVRIESNEHIAVAGGRAIVRLAQAIALNPPSCHDITVTPLGGRLWGGQLWAVGSAADPENHLEQPLNPDYSALILAAGLHAGYQPRIKFSQISHPLYARSAADARQVIEHNCAFLPGGGWNWGLKPPSRAFVGTGVVMPGSGHRIAEYLEQQQDNSKRNRYTSSSTGAVSDEAAPYETIRHALELANATNLPFFGDVANRLFCALPVVDDTTEAKRSVAKNIDARKLDEYTGTYGLLLQKLENVNNTAVVMDWSHLQDICAGGRAYVIAGGLRTKLNVLWTLALTGLINPERRLVTGIVTDSDTAAALIRAKNAYEKAPQHVHVWFKRLLSMIFPSHPLPKTAR